MRTKQSCATSSASWALRFNGALDGVRVVLSGMSTEAQLDDNLATFAAEPLLSAEENAILLEQIVPKMADMVPCTGCRYCMEGCPQSLKIPHLIHIHTRYNRHRNRHNSSLFQRPDLNRLLIRIIITWIITQKRFHIRNSYFRK